MKFRLIPSLLVSLAAALNADADVVQLRDKASMTGQILAEKRDLVVVDLGYTVVTVPRNQIVRIVRDEELAAQAAAAKARENSKGAKTNATTVAKNAPRREEKQDIRS